MTKSTTPIQNNNLNYPLNIYAINLEGFIKNGTTAVFNDLLNTVSSYVKYMGYTHVLILNGNYKTVGNLSTDKKRAVVNTFHSHGIKVIFQVMPKDVTDKKLYIYTLIQQIKDLLIDGFFFDVHFPQYCDKSLLKAINKNIHESCPGVITVLRHKLQDSSAALGFDLILDTELYRSTCDYVSRDPYFRRYVQAEFNEKLFYQDIKNRLIPLSDFDFASDYKSTLSSAYGSFSDRLMQKRSLDLLFISILGKKMTLMGDEFSGAEFEDGSPAVDWSVLDSEAHRSMRSYVRALNYFYLSNPVLQCDYNTTSITVCDETYTDKNVIAFFRTTKDDKLLTVINLSGIAQSITVQNTGNPECIFATEQYIGCDSITHLSEEKDVYSITLPAFCGAVYSFK